MLNLPQRPQRANLCRNCKAALRPLPSSQHCNSHISRWGLMGMERCVTLLPCIQETWSYKVQEERCLLSNGLTTCHCDSPPLRSICWSLCWGPWWEGVEMFMSQVWSKGKAINVRIINHHTVAGDHIIVICWFARGLEDYCGILFGIKKGAMLRREARIQLLGAMLNCGRYGYYYHRQPLKMCMNVAPPVS